MLTTTGTLRIGVVVDGVVHKEFELRTCTVQDNIDATEELIEAGEDPQALRISTALVARQLTKLGTLKPEQITTTLLRSMPPSDWNILDKASSALEKKMLQDGPLQPKDGGLPSKPGPSETGSTPTI